MAIFRSLLRPQLQYCQIVQESLQTLQQDGMVISYYHSYFVFLIHLYDLWVFQYLKFELSLNQSGFAVSASLFRYSNITPFIAGVGQNFVRIETFTIILYS
jgi:hypothetical protein